ncbi:Dynamin family-domain-containing protein [Biscogniauxia marginata]|nr:Dynamin family-domain-containing protein [Biscogniauxia marginata]
MPHLQKGITESSAEVLERLVITAVGTLDTLSNPLEKARDNSNVSRWLKYIHTLRERAKPTRTLIGVVGSTGSGKSSVINAVLDEERLVPTNCMRACTAVITELSWNYCEDPHELYRAEVEFITKEDCTIPESEAGIAYAKIKAVYPKYTKEMIANADFNALATDPEICDILGTTKAVNGSTSEEFYDQLAVYIDSKDKNTEKEGKKGDRRGRPKADQKKMEFWPLVKVVRVYTKADALSTGVVLVDLPGVQDSNAARAAIANKYLEKCTAIWVVAPIIRALQMKFDGTYLNISFIASKTDDICVTEAVDALDLNDETEDNFDPMENLRLLQAETESAVLGLRERIDIVDGNISRLDSLIEELECLQERQLATEVAHPPSPLSKKRKRPTEKSQICKRLQLNYDSDNSTEDSDADDSTTEEERDDNPQTESVTEVGIRSRLESLRSEKRIARDEKKGFLMQVEEAKQNAHRRDDEITCHQSLIKSLCVRGRNEYSREAIRRDFRQGVKELDQENAAQEDEELFNPDIDLRDYEKVAESLPVFCVSSRAYQKLCGRLKRDEEVQGFDSIGETEIPQLRNHAKLLTESGRITASKSFLNAYMKLLNSLFIWTANHEAEIELSDNEKQREASFLETDLAKIAEDMNSMVRQVRNKCEEILAKYLYSQFVPAAASATSKAIDIAKSWGEQVEDRGSATLSWSTYKATCRRAGVFAGSRGPHDFNEVLDWFISIFVQRLQKFHSWVIFRLQDNINPSALNLLNDQVLSYTQYIKDILQTFRKTMESMQREASRKFTPVILKTMAAVYDHCAKESGAGSYRRMKQAMIEHVTSNKNTMFEKSCNMAKECLDGLCKNLQAELCSGITEILRLADIDYKNAIIGLDIAQVSEAARMETRNLLEEIDVLFEDLPLEDNGYTTQIGNSMSEADDSMASTSTHTEAAPEVQPNNQTVGATPA